MTEEEYIIAGPLYEPILFGHLPDRNVVNCMICDCPMVVSDRQIDMMNSGEAGRYECTDCVYKKPHEEIELYDFKSSTGSDKKEVKIETVCLQFGKIFRKE